MRRRVFRCVLLALLAAFSAVPAAAGTIVGQFYFDRDSFLCELLGDPECVPFEQFRLENLGLAPYADLVFSAVIQFNGINYGYQFDHGPSIDPNDFIPVPVLPGGTVGTPALDPPPFAAEQVSLVFNIENAALYPGTLSLSPFSFDDDDFSLLVFSAAVEYTENGSVPVTETPSWLVVVIGLSALAVGRAFLV